MTAPRATPDAAFRAACALRRLDAADGVLLGAHATAVYHLPREDLVARVARDESAHGPAATAVAICRWLVTVGYPAPEPADVRQPVRVDGGVVTFWRHYAQGPGPSPTPGDLGRLLRRLHDLPSAPLELPPYEPLGELLGVVAGSVVLTRADRTWLLDQRLRLLDRYHRLDWPLGVGHIHGDAHPGNVLSDGRGGVLLADWDEASVGPRELDLANTYHGMRYGLRPEHCRDFATAYGEDLAGWPGLRTLLAIRDVHTLSSFIRRADRGDGAARRELAHRIDTLRRGDTSARWNPAVPMALA